jgi:hypothetical protein
VVKEGIRKLKFSQQIKKAEGTKTPKVSACYLADFLLIFCSQKSSPFLHEKLLIQ